MNVSYIIPVKNHLAKVFFSNKKAIDNKNLRGFLSVFDFYAGYEIKKRALKNRLLEKKVYKRLSFNQYPKHLLEKYPTTKYTYYVFMFPVKNKLPGKRINQNFDFWINYFNKGFEDLFWKEAILEILNNKHKTVKQSVENFYSKFKLTESEYNSNSFIRMLYKKRKDKSINPLYFLSD